MTPKQFGVADMPRGPRPWCAISEQEAVLMHVWIGLAAGLGGLKCGPAWQFSASLAGVLRFCRAAEHGRRS